MRKRLVLLSWTLVGCSGLGLSGLAPLQDGTLEGVNDASVDAQSPVETDSDAGFSPTGAPSAPDSGCCGVAPSDAGETFDAHVPGSPHGSDAGPTSYEDAAPPAHPDSGPTEDASAWSLDAGGAFDAGATDAPPTIDASVSSGSADASISYGSIDAGPSGSFDAAPPSPLRVFVTSGTYNGALGGVTGGDSICQAEASNHGMIGPFLAWLSDSQSSPATRFSSSASGYALLNGTLIAPSWQALVTTGPEVPISLTSGGAVLNAIVVNGVWTNTATDGTAFGGSLAGPSNDCDEWQSANASTPFGGGLGDSLSTSLWTVSSSTGVTVNCSNALRLYCFEQ